MKKIEKISSYKYKDFVYEIEYQYNDTLFFPIKTTVKVPVGSSFEYRPVVFSKASFKSKDDCLNFLIYETQKFIDNNFEIK